MAGEDDSGLESLIEESLRQKPSFEAVNRSNFPKVTTSVGSSPKHINLTDRLISKWPSISSAAVTALLSFPGNPAYTPPLVGAVTYFLTDIAYGLSKRNKHIKQTNVGPDTASSMYNKLFEFKPQFSALSGVFAFMASVSSSLYQRQIDLGSDVKEFYFGLAPLLPSLTSNFAFALVNCIGAYVLLNGLERVLCSESLATLVHTAAARFYRAIKKPHKAAKHFERIAAMKHSREKEVTALLQLGDTYIEAQQADDAVNAYKRMLSAAARTDDFTGVSDWLIKRAENRPYSDGEGLHYKLQKAMHEFVAGNLDEAYRQLTVASAAEPMNRRLRRVRSLFFESTKQDSLADLEMRIYEELLRRDTGLTFKVLGESRNEVLVPAEETSPFPDVYIKRSKDKAALEEEVANIKAFSEELPGLLPKVISQRSDGEYHYIVLESMGNATMFQKALARDISQSDVEAVLDLLVRVVAAGQQLQAKGKIKINEPMIEENYAYSHADSLRAQGVNPLQQNILENRTYHFMHRVTDVFALAVEQHNGVVLGDGFESVQHGALILSSIVLDPNQHFNLAYTDFNPRNIIFDTQSGNLKGKIDWEQVKRFPLLFELVNILEFYGTELAPVQRTDMFERVIKNLEKQFHISVDRRMFMRQYRAAAALRHLELTGYMSRDSATNPAYVRAQVHDYFMARFHLFEAKKHVSGEAREVLDKMYAYLERQPILKDQGEQRKLELEVRSSIIPPTSYIWHEITQKQYWQAAGQSFLNAAKAASPKEFAAVLSQKGIKGIWHDFWHTEKPAQRHSDPNLSLMGNLLIGIPTLLATLAASTSLSYALMQAIMPALSRYP